MLFGLVAGRLVLGQGLATVVASFARLLMFAALVAGVYLVASGR